MMSIFASQQEISQPVYIYPVMAPQCFDTDDWLTRLTSSL